MLTAKSHKQKTTQAKCWYLSQSTCTRLLATSAKNTPVPQTRQQRVFRSGWRMKVHLSVRPLESSFPGAVFVPDPPSPLLALPSAPNEVKCGGALVGRRWEEQQETITDGFKSSQTHTWYRTAVSLKWYTLVKFVTNYLHQTLSITLQRCLYISF